MEQEIQLYEDSLAIIVSRESSGAPSLTIVRGWDVDKFTAAEPHDGGDMYRAMVAECIEQIETHMRNEYAIISREPC